MPRTKQTISPDDVSMSVLSGSMRMYRMCDKHVAKSMGVTPSCYSQSRKDSPDDYRVKEIKRLAKTFNWTDEQVIEFIFGRKAVFDEN